MAIEIIEDILEELADKLAIYGSAKRADWTKELEERIRRAIKVEEKL